MRILAAFLFLAATAATVPQIALPEATLEAMRRDFPADHARLAGTLEGKAGEEARRLAYAGIDDFLRRHRSAIVAAPGPAVVAIEGRQGAMLRALQRRDLALCAKVGDRGFFSMEALAGLPAPGLDEYGTSLMAAAKTGSAATGPQLATREDLLAWLSAVAKIEPDVPVRDMLADREARAAAGPDKLCRGAAAMHEAVLSLPEGARERVARMLLSSVIGSVAED